MSKKLNLGCGHKHLPGYLNVDCRVETQPDILDDVAKLTTIEDGSIDEIYACHVLEHFGRHHYLAVLKRWYQLLKSGAKLRLSVPDFEAVVQRYQQTKKLREVVGLLYGGQTYPENYHYITWDFQSLAEDLQRVGFSRVERYDWRLTDHAEIDDYSQAYLPHLDKEKGLLMSLNVQAYKD